MFGFEKFRKKALCEWSLSLGPWLLARDYPISASIDYGIWRENWRNAQYAIAESIYSGHPCGERELDAIGRHVMGSDIRPQKCEGFAAYVYNTAHELGDELKMVKMDGKGFLLTLNRILHGAEENPVISDEFLPFADDFFVTLNALRIQNVNFDGARLLENLWKRTVENWPANELWPLRLAMRHILLCHDILLRWEIFAYDQAMLRKTAAPWMPSSLDFRDMLEIVS